MFLDLATEGNYVACRPSGTEPKIKFYMLRLHAARAVVESRTRPKSQLDEQMVRMEADLRKFAGV